MADQASSAKPTLTVQTFWLMVAKTIGFGLSIVLPMLLVRVFDRYQYGIYRQAFVIVATIQAMLSMGVGISAFYYLPRKKDGRGAIVLNILLFNLAAGAVPFLILFAYPQILAKLFGGPQLLVYARMIATVVLLTIFSSFLEVIATALQDVRRSTIFIVFAQFSKVVFMTFAAAWCRTVEALLWAAVAQGVLQSAILLWYLRNQFGSFWRDWDKRFFREQMSYAVPYGLHGILFTVQTDMHNYFVSNAFGPASFAIYSVGCMQIPLLGLLRDSITAVLISRTSELQHQGKTREILLMSVRAMRKTAFLYFPACAALLVLGRECLVLLYTRSYEASWPIFAINLMMLPMLVLITDPILRAFPEHRYFVVRVRIFLVCLQFLILLFATRTIGMTGAILVVVAVGALERVVLGWRCASILHARLADLRLLAGIAKVGMAAVGAGALAYVLRVLMSGYRPLPVLAACGGLFAAAFVAITLAFRLLDPDEEAMVRNQLLRVRQVLVRQGA